MLELKETLRYLFNDETVEHMKNGCSYGQSEDKECTCDKDLKPVWQQPLKKEWVE